MKYNESKFLKLLDAHTKHTQIPCGMCGLLARKKGNEVYKHMYMGNGCLCFYSAKVPGKAPMYGPGLDLFRKGSQTFPHASVSQRQPSLFQMFTAEFLQELSHMENKHFYGSSGGGNLWQYVTPTPEISQEKWCHGITKINPNFHNLGHVLPSHKSQEKNYMI